MTCKLLIFSSVGCEEGAVKGQGGSQTRTRQAATDLVEKLQSWDREAAWPGLGKQQHLVEKLQSRDREAAWSGLSEQ